MKPPFALLLFMLWLPLGLLSQVEDLPAPDPNTFVLVEKEPVPVNLNELKGMIGYPPLAKEAEIEGKVILRILLDEDGRYMRHEVIKDPHPLLTKAVEDKIAHLRFTPGIQKGKPIKVWVTIPFDFRLLKNPPQEEVTAVEPNAKFYSLKEALANPLQVKELYLHGQNLQAFPMEVLQLPNLGRLELGDNQIQSIPPEVAQLKNLWMLGVSRNALTALPAELWAMPRLRVIKVEGNPFPKPVQKSLEKEHGNALFPKDDKGKVHWQ